MRRGGARSGLLVAALLLGGCASRRVLRLENDLLRRRAEETAAALEECRAAAPPEDYAAEVDLDVLRDFLARLGYTEPEERPGDVLVVRVDGEDGPFDVAVQLFEQQHVVFVTTSAWFDISEARSPEALIMLLTRMATANFDLLLGKLQLDPRTGVVSLSVELNTDDGLGLRTFGAAFRHLVRTASELRPELRAVARMEDP